MTRVTVTRRVVADPPGVALLLAEPQPWADAGYSWRVQPPTRDGDQFTAELHVTDPAHRSLAGDITVTPSDVTGCELRLVVDAPNRAAARRLERSAAAFLDALGVRARERSAAA
ncbi:MAG TPA: hypothetical protein VME70_14625 [Mycobacteriales bacterium]|nr:hypothetical protein [Mycobacteriales bacterium]